MGNFPLDSADIKPPAIWHTLEVEMVGSQYRVFLDRQEAPGREGYVSKKAAESVCDKIRRADAL